MGSVQGGPRRPNTTVYFIVLGGILILLVLLCCYFLYFCITKVKELSRENSPLQTATPPRTTPTPAYPVQPGVREGATAMAKLCRQLPAGTATVFPSEAPAPTAPGAPNTNTAPDAPAAPEPVGPKCPAPPAAATITASAVS